MKLRPRNLLIIFGTRPEAIKLAPLIRELKSRPAEFQTRTCVTAQHRGLLDQVLGAFEIAPDHDLEVMREAQDLFQITALCLDRLRPVLETERPDWVVVQGDTTTTFAASLAAFYLHVRVAHVEAGLRTGDRNLPFPEEMNRRLISPLASLHFAPTVRARENLIREGVEEKNIHVTGNTGIDALCYARERCAGKPPSVRGLENWTASRRMILVTGHRRESFGASLRQICQALRQIASRGDVDIIYSVHRNPNVERPVRELLGSVANVFLVEPPDYFSFVGLMERAHIILTDSGGIQEEAPSLGKPVLVMREVTERPEAVEAGTAKLVGTNRERIVEETTRLLEDREEYARMSRVLYPFGDGQASQRIARVLAEHPL
jgi:UDP-N-acetylglucosamine 2-epimerase (non-hydrolysing)